MACECPCVIFVDNEHERPTVKGTKESTRRLEHLIAYGEMSEEFLTEIWKLNGYYLGVPLSPLC